MTQLSELFATASQNTRFHSIEEGLGYGRIRISLLFRPVEAKLPPNLLGFDTGTLVINDISAKLEHNKSLRGMQRNVQAWFERRQMQKLRQGLLFGMFERTRRGRIQSNPRHEWL